MSRSLSASRRRPYGVRLALLTAATAGLLWGIPQAASAHVTVRADSTASGSFSALTFRVPNESDTAGTVKVAVTLPTDSPFLYVSSKPVPGWRTTVTEAPLPEPVESYGTTITKAARTVTWTAEGRTQIRPGEYQEFALSVGPLPAPTTVLLPAVQSYSDGEVVRWDQPTPEGGEEPEHPAPVLTVTAAAAEPTATPGPAEGVAAATAAATADPVARWLSGGALAVALLGSGVAALALRRRGDAR